MTAFICLCTGAFWLSTHINLNLCLTLHRVAFLRNHPLAPERAPALGSFSWVPGGALSVRSHRSSSLPLPARRRVNDSFAPSDLLNNWTVVYPCHSEGPPSPPCTFSVWLEYLQPPSWSTCLNAWRKQNIYCLSRPGVCSFHPAPSLPFTSHGRLASWLGTPQYFPRLCCRVCLISSRQKDGFWLGLTF